MSTPDTIYFTNDGDQTPAGGVNVGSPPLTLLLGKDYLPIPTDFNDVPREYHSYLAGPSRPRNRCARRQSGNIYRCQPMMKKRLSHYDRHRIYGAFSLIEILLAVSVVTIMVLILGQLMGHATTITRTGSKHIDTDTQARVVLDRMAIDIAQMLKRTDIDYYLKGSGGYTGHGNGHGNGHKVTVGQQGSDQIAFFSQVPGYNSTSYSSTGPLSLVAYRINSLPASPAYLRMERLGKGLLWNGMFNNTVSNPNNKNSRNIWYPSNFRTGPNRCRGRPPAHGRRRGVHGLQQSPTILMET